MILHETIYIGAAVLIMAATTAGIGAKRQSSDIKSSTSSEIGAGESEHTPSKCCFGHTANFFKMGTDLAGITWAHAVNNRHLLESALADKKIMMLEADVIMGSPLCSTQMITSKTGCNKTDDIESGSEVSKSVPIMGHPPATKSDLTLENMLLEVMTQNRDNAPGGPKGLKLDFKSTEAFEASLPIITEHYPKIMFPLWLNADILPGPGQNNDHIPVDAQRFLSGTTNFPTSKLSLGWTTRYCKDYPDGEYCGSNSEAVLYSQQQVTDMLGLLASTDISRNVTFPVRAGIAANCSELMLSLLRERSTYTLTIWSAEDDYVDTGKLSSLLQQAGSDRYYLDVPKSVSEKLNLNDFNQEQSNLLEDPGNEI